MSARALHTSALSAKQHELHGVHLPLPPRPPFTAADLHACTPSVRSFCTPLGVLAISSSRTPVALKTPAAHSELLHRQSVSVMRENRRHSRSRQRPSQASPAAGNAIASRQRTCTSDLCRRLLECTSSASSLKPRKAARRRASPWSSSVLIQKMALPRCECPSITVHW